MCGGEREGGRDSVCGRERETVCVGEREREGERDSVREEGRKREGDRSPRESSLCRLQGYLAYKKTHPPRTLP